MGSRVLRDFPRVADNIMGSGDDSTFVSCLTQSLLLEPLRDTSHALSSLSKTVKS